MRNLKKILALSLVFAMVFSLSFSALAVERKDFADGGDLNPLYNNSVDLLLQLGVLQGKPGGSLDPQGVYTRAEMAYLTAAIMLGGNIAAAEPYQNAAYRAANGIASFSDVYDTDWYAGALYYLAHLGIVTGTGDGKFNPNGEAARLQVAAFALGIIGYKKDIQGYEGTAWTLNVQRDAAYCGLYTDISASETTISREQVFKMMDNALMNDSIDYNPVTGQSFYPTDANGRNVSVLEIRFKQYERLEGLFVANQYANLTGGATEKGRIQLTITTQTGGTTSVHDAIIDNVDMAKAPVSALGRMVRVFAKRTNLLNNRYDGLLGNVIPTDEIVPIGLSDDANDFKNHADRNPLDENNLRSNVAGIATVTGFGTRSSTPPGPGATASQWANGFQKGQLTEAYAVRQYGSSYYTYVFRNTWTLAEISNVADNGKVTAVAFKDAGSVVFEDADPTKFENGGNVKAGDIVFALMNGDDPVTVQPVANLKANLTSRTGQDVTLSGTVYNVLDTVFNGGNNRSDLLDSIVDAGNYGVQRDYYLWTNAVTGAVKVVGYRGPASPDATYCIVLDATSGNRLSAYTGVKILMDDGTTGIYSLSSLKTINSAYNFIDDDVKYKTTNGKEVIASSGAGTYASKTSNVYVASTSSLAPTVLYQYEISDDGESVALTEAKTTAAYFEAYKSAVTLDFNAGSSYKKGNGYFNNGTITSLTNNSLIFANDGDNYYCFKGRTASDFDETKGDKGVWAQGRDGSLRFAYIEYSNALGIGGNYGVLSSAITVSGNDKNLTLSFKMFDLETGTNKDYVVSNFADESGTVLTSGTQPKIGKGTIVEYTITENIIKKMKAIDPTIMNSGTPTNLFGGIATDSSLKALNDDFWFTVRVGNVSGFNAYVLSDLVNIEANKYVGDAMASRTALGGATVSTTTALKNILTIDNDAMFADLRDGADKPKTANANTIDSVWKNAASAATQTALIAGNIAPDGTRILADPDDTSFVVDVKLSVDANGRLKASAVVIRSGGKVRTYDATAPTMAP